MCQREAEQSLFDSLEHTNSVFCAATLLQKKHEALVQRLVDD
jgi:hypothetical protein